MNFVDFQKDLTALTETEYGTFYASMECLQKSLTLTNLSHLRCGTQCTRFFSKVSHTVDSLQLHRPIAVVRFLVSLPDMPPGAY